MKNNYFLMLLASAFLLFSCRTELEPNEKTQEKDQGRSKIITLANLQSQIGEENLSKEFQIPVTSNSSKTELTDFIVDEAKIIELENNPSDINYSMVVYPRIPKDENVFYNLMIRKNNGNISKIIYKYTPDINWFNDYNNKIYHEYKGKIDLVYKEGNFPTDTSSKAVQCFAQYIEIPCEYGYYHDDAHCEGDGSYFIKIMTCIDTGGGGATISYGGPGPSGNGSSTGTIVTPLSLDTPMPYGNEYNNAYQSFKFDMHFAPNEKQWLSTHASASVNLFWYVYNMGNTDEAFAVAKKYIQFAIAGQNQQSFSSFPFSWMINFITENPTVTAEQFKDWFLTNTSNNFIQQVLSENPMTILNYETLSSPNFKMRKVDQLKYPKFTTLVKSLKTEIQNNPVTLNRLVELTGLTEQQVLASLTFGQGPSIRLVPNLTGPSGPNYGNFNPADPTYINVNLDFVLGLEQSSLSSTRHATAFLLAVTILHEFIHFGNYVTGYDTQGNEMGNLFEISTYGIIITHYNAGYYIIQLK